MTDIPDKIVTPAKLKVAVIDPNPEQLKQIQAEMEELGCEVQTFYNRSLADIEAGDKAQHSGKFSREFDDLQQLNGDLRVFRPDLVIMDHSLHDHRLDDVLDSNSVVGMINNAFHMDRVPPKIIVQSDLFRQSESPHFLQAETTEQLTSQGAIVQADNDVAGRAAVVAQLQGDRSAGRVAERRVLSPNWDKL